MSLVDRGMALVLPKFVDRLNATAELAREEIYAVLEESKVGSGRHHPGNPRPSSAPGDPPARQTGRLQESVKVMQRATVRDLTATVGPDPSHFPQDYYAARLEFGSRRVAPRPFMRPAAARLKRKLGS